MRIAQARRQARYEVSVCLKCTSYICTYGLEQKVDDTEVKGLAGLGLAVLGIIELSLLSDGSRDEVLGVLRVMAPVVASLELYVALSLGTKLFLFVAEWFANLGCGTGLGATGDLRDSGVALRTVSGFVDGDSVDTADFGWSIGGLQRDRAVGSLVGAGVG
jgi:hypothetical protein